MKCFAALWRTVFVFRSADHEKKKTGGIYTYPFWSPAPFFTVRICSRKQKKRNTLVYFRRRRQKKKVKDFAAGVFFFFFVFLVIFSTINFVRNFFCGFLFRDLSSNLNLRRFPLSADEEKPLIMNK